MNRSYRPFIALALLSVAGCSSSSVPLNKADQEYANAICTMLANCPQAGLNATIERLEATHPGTATCADQQIQSGNVDLTKYQASVAAGRIKYDGTAAQKCLDALAASCTGVNSNRASAVSPACDQVWVGQVAIGGTCMLDEDCAGAATCQGNGGAQCGTCVALVPIGQPCQRSGECDASTVTNGYVTCTPTAANPADHCVAVTLAGGVAGGGSCGLTNQTGETWTDSSCANGLYCRRTGGGNGTGVCATPIALGQACSPAADVCAGDAACAPNTGATPGNSCQNVTIQTSAGQPCSDATLQFCNPLDRLACSGASCVLVGTGVAGQPCRASAQTADCNQGLYCDTKAGPTAYDGLCANQIATGMTCDPATSEACQTGYCDDVTMPTAPVCGLPVCH